MADLPQIWARPSVPFQNLPGVRSIAPGFVTLAQVAEGMAERQGALDVARQSSEYDIGVEDLKNSLEGTDPNTWRASFIKGEAELRKTFGEGRAGTALHIHADKRYGTNINDITTRQIRASREQQKGTIEALRESLAQEIAITDDEEKKKNLTNTFHAAVNTAATPTLIGGKPAPASITPLERENLIQAFDRQIVKNEAENGVANAPSQLIKDLNTPKYSLLTPTEKREYKTKANTAIRDDIRLQEAEAKAESRKANNNIQQMVDQGVSTQLIQAKLEEYTTANVMDDMDRARWAARLKQGTKQDTPEQVQNMNSLLANFNSQYPSPKTVRDTRDLMNKMSDDGRLGDVGAATVGGKVNAAQAHIASEGRAIEAAGRAAANATGVKVTDAQAARIIAENYPQDAGRTASKGHKQDIAQYNEATVGVKGVDKGEVARKIRDDRAKTIQATRARTKLQNELPTDQAAALKELQALKKK